MLHYIKRLNIEFNILKNEILIKGIFGSSISNIKDTSNYIKYWFFLKKKNHLFFLKKIFYILRCLFFGWYLELKILGWTYYWTKRKTDSLLQIHLGFNHDIGIKFPFFFHFRVKKRQIFIFSTDFFFLKNLAKMLKQLRFMTSYKLKGILFLNEKVIIKQGKKEKFF
jgi:hypothetical protein